MLVVWGLLLLWLGCLFLPSGPSGEIVEEPPVVEEPSVVSQDLVAAVYYAPGRSQGWQDRLAALEQTTAANATAKAVPVGEPLEGYDLVVADPSLLDSGDWDACRRTLTKYVREGGYLVLDNCFDTAFTKEFLGIEAIWPMSVAPMELTTPEGPEELDELKTLLTDFAALYPNYYNAEALAALDYGDGFTPGTCETLAEQDGLAVYTLNHVGEGGVFLTNPMLPNVFSVTSTELKETVEGQEPFAGTTAGANRLFYGKVLAYVGKARYGYALERVYGSFGTNPFSWELHYEDITAVEHGACYDFAELCEKAGQIPSFSLVRNFYWWYLRAESVSYLTNQDEQGMRFERDEVEDVYSSGTHVVSGDGWLSQVWVERTNSYFSDTGGYDQRAYVSLCDMNGDGRLDILAGSSDGRLYFYAAQENNERFTVDEAVILTGPNGEPLVTPAGYSAPTAMDVDGDGVLDIVTGTGCGFIYWARGLGEMKFAGLEQLLDPYLGAGQIFPERADMDGDGKDDLLVGSVESGLAIFYGLGNGGFERREAVWLPVELRQWAAPCATDLNGDGRLDIALGTFHGYVARLIWDEGTETYVHRGYLDGSEPNYKGNVHLKFGNNCKPAFGDVNGDGRDDLVCGHLEYGLAYPVDSPYFPHRQELQEQIKWMQKNSYYISTHTITHWYASQDYEEREFGRTWDALEGYGVDLSRTGTNQHTWHSSGRAGQTFLAQYKNGMLWNSGAEMPDSAATPQLAAENALFLPFFLKDGGEDAMLLLNVSTLTYRQEGWETISARYGVPMLMYFHCDMIYKDDDLSQKTVRQAGRFLRDNDYMCVREDQLAYASAAALNAQVSTWADEEGTIHLSAAPVSTEFAMYDESYQNAVGVKVSFAPGVEPEDVTTNATVWRQEGEYLYLSLDKPVTLKQEKDSGKSHLRRVSLPADIHEEPEGLVVDFSQGGLMQVEVAGRATTTSEGWAVISHWKTTEFRKTGEASKLVLTLS